MWTVGDRLRKAREDSHIGVEEMANRLGRQRNSIRRWERSAIVQRMVITVYALNTGVRASWIESGCDPADTTSITCGYFSWLRPRFALKFAA
jgi:transcriptional regulator with XRE-family HTH domain